MDVIYRQDDDRWVRGDRLIRRAMRAVLGRRPPYASGMQVVVRNFLRGLSRRRIPYRFNPWRPGPSREGPVICFGLGLLGLRGISRSTPVIAAIGFPHPAELPTLCEDFRIVKFLQHSEWVLDLAMSAGVYPPSVFDRWPAGVDTREWLPSTAPKDIDVLIYHKPHPEVRGAQAELLQAIRRDLGARGLSVAEIVYREYTPDSYKRLLSRTRAMVFLSAHESQGLAYQECLSSGVPVFAWDQGYWLDPARHRYGAPVVRATSVPFFDARCGARFADVTGFCSGFDAFWDAVRGGAFSPREYVEENVSIEVSTERMLAIYRECAR